MRKHAGGVTECRGDLRDEVTCGDAPASENLHTKYVPVKIRGNLQKCVLIRLFYLDNISYIYNMIQINYSYLIHIYMMICTIINK